MDEDYIGPVSLDPVTERAGALIALAGTVEQTKDRTSKRLLQDYMEKIVRSIQVPSAQVVELKAIEGGKQ